MMTIPIGGNGDPEVNKDGGVLIARLRRRQLITIQAATMVIRWRRV